MTLLKIRLRGLGVGSAATLGLALAVRFLGTGLVVPPTGDSPGTVTGLCTVALLGALFWGWVAVVAGVWDAWRRAERPGGATVRRTGGVRGWTLTACGVAVTGAALAAPAAHASPPWVPVPPTSEQVSVLVSRPAAPPEHPDRVVVRAGDCLWSLAASEVQSGAGPATVTARWRAIYRANRGVIGDDPDVIHPGQRLRLPR